MAGPSPVVGAFPPIEFLDLAEYRSVVEALLCVTSGGFSTRATSEVGPPVGVTDAVRVNGIFSTEPPGELVAGPDWAPACPTGTGRRWRLDLHRGLVEHEVDVDDSTTVRIVRFCSAARPGTGVIWIDQCPPAAFEPLNGTEPTILAGLRRSAAICVAEVRSPAAVLRVAAAAHASTEQEATHRAATLADQACAAGGPALVDEHVRSWSRRWTDAQVTIDGPPLDQAAANFTLFHLLSIPDGHDELAVGARALTGPAYGGHVFWDADVFVLPALTAIAPDAARAMLEYRVNRLDAARDRAAAEGRPGARFPWESAASGNEMTPTSATRIDGRRIEVVTGDQEIHISSDIAWAALHYARWTGDREFLAGPGTDLVLETARYLAARIEVGPDGRGHLRQIMGPDEYHEAVDDNAYTNVMTRWHLRQAARLTPDPVEAGRMRRLADLLVDGYLPGSGRHEQFTGFDQLEPVLITAVAQPPVAADILLGADLVARSQIVKQADVVMMHHLVPEELPAGSAAADLDHYVPRTAHGSSLSPAVYASVLARAGRPDEALHHLRVALHIDLEDLTGTTAGGIHAATMGGAWQALAFGYLGLAVHDDHTLALDPVLPTDWDRLTMRSRVRGHLVEVSADRDEVRLEGERPLNITWPGSTHAPALDRLRLVGGPGKWRRAP